MYYRNNSIVYSPSDLTRFMESPFASWMDRFVLDNKDARAYKDAPDPLMQRLADKGYAHEDKQEAEFLAQGKSVVKITSKHEQAIEDTLMAMKQGADVIIQAYLKLEPFYGYADFLVKVPGASELGDYHYEVWDTKLASSVKPKFMMQLCCYAEMLESIQGVLPKSLTVSLGNDNKATYQTINYFAYYQQLKKQFLNEQSQFIPTNFPDPYDSKSYLDWSEYAEAYLEECDHLSLVANIRRSQVQKLEQAGIMTLTELANSELLEVPKISPEVFTRLKTQAQYQLKSRGQAKPAYMVIKPKDEDAQVLGLQHLPPHSNYDVFFDIEGFPLVEGGLEYLWGATFYESDGSRSFRDFWAHTQEEEKKAFESFITWAYQRWRKDPTMHIYHYASYEVTACRRLMGRYGVCEHEVDELLRNNVFVDLYKIVKNGLIIGEPKYSIKNVEHLYRSGRETEVGTGGDSVVVYDQWRDLYASGDEGYSWRDSKILKDIRDYNIDDCNSTEELTLWLRERQHEHGIRYVGNDEREEKEPSEEITEKTLLRDKLLLKAEHDNSLDEAHKQLTGNMAWYLEFHRRNDKPVYWRLFDRLGLTDEELKDDMDCLAVCVRTDKAPEKPTPKAKHLAYEYQFDADQEFKGAVKEYYILCAETEDGKSVKVKYIKDLSDLDNGLISVQSKEEPPQVITLIPNEVLRADIIESAIFDMVKDFDDEQFSSKYPAIYDYLLRRNPRIKGHSGGAIVSGDNIAERLEQTIAAIAALDNSYLPIQGPPGAGKTYTGKKAITELLKDSKRIGIVSNSHKAITNLLLAAKNECTDNGVSASFISTNTSDKEELIEQGISVVKNGDIAKQLEPSCVVGTTAWGFSREDLAQEFDYLFVDEAGQVSVANLIACSRSAKNIVILGDQMQLGQPTEGTHPDDSGLSVLDYLMKGKSTIEPSMGVFLDTTFRMHPKVNQFISDYVYDGKLNSDENASERVISVPENGSGMIDINSGIKFIPVDHKGNTQGSDEEVEVVEQLVQELVGRDFYDGSVTRPLTLDDILFVAPYNLQVRKLQAKLGHKAKVGSVDKFQGQEAPVVILSMCTSDPNDSPRGLEFIFDKNRLNVAISRAQTLAFVVGSPELAITNTNRVEQLERVNMFSALVEC